MAGTPPPHPTSPLPRLPLQALARASSVWIPSPPQQLDPARVYHAGPSQPKRGGNGRPETCKPAVDRPRAGTQSRPPPSDTLNGSVFQGPPPPLAVPLAHGRPPPRTICRVPHFPSGTRPWRAPSPSRPPARPSLLGRRRARGHPSPLLLLPPPRRRCSRRRRSCGRDLCGLCAAAVAPRPCGIVARGGVAQGDGRGRRRTLVFVL